MDRLRMNSDWNWASKKFPWAKAMSPVHRVAHLERVERRFLLCFAGGKMARGVGGLERILYRLTCGRWGAKGQSTYLGAPVKRAQRRFNTAARANCRARDGS